MSKKLCIAVSMFYLRFAWSDVLISVKLCDNLRQPAITCNNLRQPVTTSFSWPVTLFYFLFKGIIQSSLPNKIWHLANIDNIVFGPPLLFQMCLLEAKQFKIIVTPIPYLLQRKI